MLIPKRINYSKKEATYEIADSEIITFKKGHFRLHKKNIIACYIVDKWQYSFGNSVKTGKYLKLYEYENIYIIYSLIEKYYQQYAKELKIKV